MLKKRILRVLALLAAVSMLSGCSYAKARGYDFADMFKLNGGLHVGVSAEARALIFGFGVGVAQSNRYGIEKKGIFTEWDELEVGFPVINAWGIYDLLDGMYKQGASTERALGSYYSEATEAAFECQKRREIYIPIIAFPMSYTEVDINRKDTFVEYFWVEAGAGALVGARAGFNPLELVDFIVGLSTLDILGDDRRADEPAGTGTQRTGGEKAAK